MTLHCVRDPCFNPLLAIRRRFDAPVFKEVALTDMAVAGLKDSQVHHTPEHLPATETTGTCCGKPLSLSAALS
jgi:hypothetical protein